MTVVSKAHQSIALIHPTHGTQEVHPQIITTLHADYSDLNVFKMYQKAGLIEASGAKEDGNADVEEIAKELKEELDIPDEVKSDLRKYNITYTAETGQEYLIKELSKKKKIYEEGVQFIKDSGESIHHKSNYDTVIKKVKEIEDRS